MKSGATPCSRATEAASTPSRSVTMNRPGISCADAPALNAGDSCGARLEEGDDDVVGESAQAARTPATANADANRLMVVRDIDVVLLWNGNTSTRTSGTEN